MASLFDIVNQYFSNAGSILADVSNSLGGREEVTETPVQNQYVVSEPTTSDVDIAVEPSKVQANHDEEDEPSVVVEQGSEQDHQQDTQLDQGRDLNPSFNADGSSNVLVPDDIRDNIVHGMSESNSSLNEANRIVGEALRKLDVQDYLDRRAAEQRDYNASFTVPIALGQAGIDYQDPMYQQALENARNAEYDPTSIETEFNRRFTDGNGNPLLNPLDWNVIGFTSQTKTPDEIMSAYDNFYANEGNIEPTSKSADSDTRRNLGNVDRYLIDDGSNEESRDALYMTGEQYLRYVNGMGMPGRSTYEIDPDALYNKQDEMENYGFIPYITSDEEASGAMFPTEGFHNQASMAKTSNVFNHLANARRELVDFTVDHNGEKYSGSDLMKGAAPYMRKVNEQMKDSSRYITDPDKVTEFSLPHVPVYTVVDEDTGESYDFIGEPSNVDQYEDGSIRVTWPDGMYVDFADEDDVNSSVDMNYRQAGDGEEDKVTLWIDVDPFDAGNGRLLRADEAQELFSQLGNEDALDYGPLGMGRPTVETPAEGFVPWITDMLLGSAPLFWAPVSGVQAAGAAANSFQGISPGYQNYLNGTYSKLSDEPTEEQRWAATLGSAALPLTERLYGNIGGKFLTKIPGLNKFGNWVDKKNPIVQHGFGTLGEALEEVPGNAVEELMQGYGPSEWYADEVLDENGKPIVDSSGHSLRNTDTSLTQRFHNFGEDAPLAMLGGGLLGGVLGLGRMGEYRNNYMNANGDDSMKPGYSDGIVVPLSDEEIRFYNR